VRLVSSDGAVVELRPTGYEFPWAGQGSAEGTDRTAASYVDRDADWLVIRGDIRLADGRSWTFTFPCLTTWEAEELSKWLDAASQGAADPGAPVLTEPNLGFDIDGRDGDQVRIRVHFWAESRPSWLPRARGGCAVVLDVSTAHLAAAVRDWDRERQAFPARYPQPG